jgi:hypothetical protein
MAQVCIRYRCFVATAFAKFLISIRYNCTAVKGAEQPETPETVVSSTLDSMAASALLLSTSAVLVWICRLKRHLAVP